MCTDQGGNCHGRVTSNNSHHNHVNYVTSCVIINDSGFLNISRTIYDYRL